MHSINLEYKLDPAKRIIDTPRMHCNYQNLIHAYEILENYWSKLIVNDSYDKHYLISRQITGLIQLLELPSFERYVFARGQIDAVAAGKALERSYACLYGNDTFPPGFDINPINSRRGIGFNYIWQVRGRRSAWLAGGLSAWLVPAAFTNLCQTKTSDLRNLCSTLERKQPSV
jgi:hypothetical protein